MSFCLRALFSPKKETVVRLSLVLLAILLLAACDDRPPATPAPILEVSEPALLAASADGDLVPAAGEIRPLAVWLPAFSGMAADDAAGDVLQTAILQFQQAHPGLGIEVQVKAESGVAALWPFLRTAQAVAPTVLPDLVLIDTQHLWQAADLGMVVALSEAELAPLDDFYAASLDSVHYDTRLLGIPYTVDVAHVIYDEAELDNAPLTWEDLLAEAPAYLFPGSSVDGQVNLHTVAQYLGAGGEVAEAGPTFDADAARAYFDFLSMGQLQGIIPPEVAELGTFPAVYTAYQQNPTGLATVLSDNVFDNAISGVEGAQLHYAPLPTRNGDPATVVDSWAFAVLTQDGERQRLALDLVAALLEPEVHGVWSQYAHRFPSRRSALSAWDQSDPYQEFLAAQIESATALPNGRAFADFARRLQAGQTAVLRGDLTPEEAVRALGNGP